MLQSAPYFPNPHPYLSNVSVLFLQNQKPTLPKRNSNSLSLLFAFLNSLGQQAVSPGSINQRVEIALLFLCVCLKDKQSVLFKISRYSFFTKWTSTVLF